MIIVVILYHFHLMVIWSAIGAYSNDGNGTNAGHVRVYQNNNGSWTQLGQDIDGENSGSQSGFSVSLSSQGNVVAIGAPNNNGNGTYSGHVRVYENNNGSWTQIGQDINGEASYDYSGQSVSMSSDGNIVAIGLIKMMVSLITQDMFVFMKIIMVHGLN